MKKILIPIGALLISGLSQAQLTNTENYVYSKTYLDYNGTTATKTSETVQYFDGLGRPKQVVNVKASPTGKDVVTHIEYDGFGRQVKDFLPVPQQGTQNGAIYTSPLSNATQPALYGQEKIFSEKILESSPLDRILQQKQVGNDWSNKPVQFAYDANTTADAVKKYNLVTTWENGATKSGFIPTTAYAAAQLYKNTVTDEDGNQTIEFKNGEGQVVLVRKMLSATEKADTYYVYNEFNQLAYVIPPLAAVSGVTDETTLNNLCYQYRYDGRNRLVEKKLPGKGWEYMLYDKQDRLVLTRDANLEAQGQWLFTKYDQFSRPIYTGLVYSPPGRAQQVAAVEGLGSNNEVRTTSSFNNTGMDVYYTTSSAYPQYNYTLLSVNYYDTYPSYSFNPTFPTNILGETTLTQTPTAEGLSTKSLPVMSLVKNIEDDNWTKNYTYYDKKGRAIGSYSINHLGGRTQVESKLDFAGVVQQSITRHKRLSTDTDKVITENFTYDSQNRLKTHTHQVDNNPVEYLAQNTYNELSQLQTKKVGGTALGSGLQTVDYQYNIRGWMTKINDPKNLNGKLFGYEIKYNNPENAAPKFNGNIAEVDWITGTVPNGTKRRYSYEYDKLNRLLQGIYSEPGSSVLNNNYYNELLSYDLNGNISTLKRFSSPSSGTTAEKIDDLVYNYTGNRLDMITLPSGVANNPSGYNALQNTIAYDLNGNMTNHFDKRINSITYNYLNLPSAITAGSGKSGSQTNYFYRADGVKIKKMYSYNTLSIDEYITQVSTTDYLDGFQYQISQSPLYVLRLKFVPTAEGYFNFENNKYIYNYVDHLGNTRVSYFHNGSGIEVLEENNYYPFGLKHEGYNALAGNPSYQYKYNGKELQETGMYDYGARFYMPDIGRFGTHDPLSSTTLDPYGYTYNNPINIIDPTGMQGEDWIKRGSQVFFDASVKSQADAVGKYGESAQHLGEGSTLTTSNSEGVLSQYTFHDNGTVSNASGTVLDTGSDTVTEGGTTIMGSTNSMFSEGVHSFLAESSNPNPLEQYRAYRDNPNYNAGESRLDRTFRLMNSGHIEQMRDVASGFAAGGYGRITGTTLYRAVSPAELSDISASGALRVSSAGYETGKLFTNSASNASQFGKWLYNWDQTPMTIIRVQVPNAVMKSATNFTADGLPATSIPANQLRAIKSIEALKYSPVAK